MNFVRLLLLGVLLSAGWFGPTRAIAQADNDGPKPGPPGEVSSFPEPWQIWSRNPVSTTLQLEFSVNASANVVLTAAGQSFTNSGVGCGSLGATNKYFPSLQPYERYQFAITGSSWEGAELYFKAYTPRNLLPKRGPRSIPRHFRVYINGEELREVDPLTISFGSCGNNTTNFIVEVRPDKGLRPVTSGAYEEQWSGDEDQVSAAPGDGQWPEIGPGRSTNAASGSFRWATSLGRLRNGLTVGKIRLNEQEVSSNLFNCASLSYTARLTNQAELHVITNANGSLRQIRAPQAFVDLTSTYSPTEESVLKFYNLTNVSTTTNGSGVYTILTNLPFVTWRIRNPNSPGTYRQFQVIEERPTSRTITSDISYDSATKVWQLTYGLGSEQRIEKRTVNITSGTRQETVELKSASVTLYKAVEKYFQFAWGWELTNVVTNPDGQPLTNSFVYYTNSAQEAAFTKLKERWYPGGRWELHRHPYTDEFGDPQCDDWPFGSFADYSGNKDARQLIIRPLMEVPSTPAAATDITQVIISETRRFPNNISHYPTFIAQDLAFDTNNFATVLDWVAVADGDYNLPDAGSLTMWEQRWHGKNVYGISDLSSVSSSDLTRRYRAFGHWLHDLVRLHINKNEDTELFEYFPGFFNPSTKAWTNDETNGTDLATVKTTGLSGLFMTQYPEAYYDDLAYWDIVTVGLSTVLGKSTQEETYLQRGLPVYTRLLGMSDISGGDPVFTLLESRVRSYDSLGHLTNEMWIDGRNSSITRTTYQASWQDSGGKDCELKAWDVNELGEKFTYAYDSQKRATNITRVGVAASGVYPAQSNLSTNRVFNVLGWPLQEVVTSGSLSLTQTYAFDLAGRMTQARSFDGITNNVTYSSDTRTTTETFPGSLTKVTTRYLDERLKSLTGTSIVPEHHIYRVEHHSNQNDDDTANIKGVFTDRTTYGTNGAPRWKEKVSGAFGKVVVERLPAFSLTNGAPPLETTFSYLEGGDTYWSGGVLQDEVLIETRVPATVLDGEVNNQLEQRFSTGDFPYLYGYQAPYVRLIGAGGANRESSQDTTIEHDGTDWWRVTRQWHIGADYSTRTNTTKERLTGFSIGTTLADATQTDADGNVTTITITVDQSLKKLTAITNTPTSTINVTGVTINGLPQSLNTESLSTPTYTYYDSLRRQTGTKDPIGFTTSTAYDAITGWVTSRTSSSGKTTQYTYYTTTEANAGKVKSQTDPNGKKTYYAYNDRGQQTRLWGDVPYPEERVFDPIYGDQTELRTFRSELTWSSSTWPGGTNFDKTVWNYDAATGLVLSKVDAANKGYTNVYYATRNLWTKSWSRGVTVTNVYSAFGDLLRKDYSDGTPSVVIADYNPLGQITQLTDGFGTRAIYRDADGELVSTVFGYDGPFDGLSLTNRINSLYGRDQVVLDSQIWGGEFKFVTEYKFDTVSSRLQSVQTSFTSAAVPTPVTNSTIYAYHANSDLVNTVTAKANTTTVLTTTKGWDYGYRLRSTRSVLGASGTPVAQFNYDYDDVDRRTSATLVDNSAWTYDYDNRNEITGGVRYWADQTPVAGQQFEYGYDPIGNRKFTKRGGDAIGANRLTTTYSVNQLNQYTNIANPSAVDILGLANAPATVQVNGVAAYEKEEYYWRSLPVSNGSAVVWASVTNSATQGTTTNRIGRLFVPSATERPQYDADGNLTQDTRWQYSWDAENRLTRMETLTSAVTAGVPRMRLDFGYDWEGRRLSKTVLTGWVSTNYATTNITRFVWDNWNLVAELSEANVPIRSYAWGLDLSGMLEDEGNVGGMVEMLDHSTGPPGRHFAAYDGNGNLVATVNASSVVSSRMEFGPFGEVIRRTANVSLPLQWSTRYTDVETDLTYYGFRFYDCRLGRWIGRDPIEEQDTVNLFAYVKNGPLLQFDRLGKDGNLIETQTTAEIQADGEGSGASVATKRLSDIRKLVDEFNVMQQEISNALDIIDALNPDGLDDFFFKAIKGANEVFANGVKGLGAKAPVHHVGTNKGKHIYNKLFEDLFKALGYDHGKHPGNLLPLPGHGGNHPPKYHQMVLKRLTEALEGGRKSFLKELIKIRIELLKNPNLTK
jgi:RHS repeat-associated protein